MISKLLIKIVFLWLDDCKGLMYWMYSIVTGSAVAAADTISAPWTPTSSGPPPDANGSGSDTKNLDVGEISDVSSFTVSNDKYSNDNLFLYPPINSFDIIVQVLLC